MENIGTNQSKKFPIEILLLPALADNYIFLLADFENGTAAAVDPAEAHAILDILTEKKLKLTHIFNTHHHSDHVGGNLQLLNHFPNAKIFAGEHDRGRIPGATHFLAHNDTVEFSGQIGQIFYIPGHTLGHIAYFFETLSTGGDIFLGDTLFGCGCGKLFEGTYAQMLSSLQKIRNLPNSTRVWCAHEYTQKNAEVALLLEEKSQNLSLHLMRVKEIRSRNMPTVPVNLGVEKLVNPFLRWDCPNLQNSLGTQGDLATFTFVRDFRDKY